MYYLYVVSLEGFIKASWITMGCINSCFT